MIRLTTPTSSGHRTQHVAPDAIASITEASTSSQWHGIRAIVKLFDRSTIECSETAAEIAAQVDASQGARS